MAESHDITVIIPAKDRLWSLPRAVDSCRGTECRVQIIVIDDASTDGSREWLEAQADVTVLAGEGWGKPAAVNRAMAVADGEYTRFLDSDDWLADGANDRQLAIARRENADVVVAGLHFYDDEVRQRTVPWQATDDFIAQQLGESFGSVYSAFLFRRAFVADVPHRTHFPAADFASRDDRCYLLEVALRHPRVAVCDAPTVCIRTHDQARLQFRGGLKGVGTHIQHLYIYRQILGLLETRGELTPRRRRAAIKVLWPLAHWIAYSHFDEACEVAKWIRELDPDFRPPEVGLLGTLYRRLGFAMTERILAMRRSALQATRAT